VTLLPEYVRVDNFKLSYSAITDDPGSITAQFFYKKEGGSFSAFGPVINGASGQIQVGSAQINEQKQYTFRVEINGNLAASETGTTYDVTGTASARDYSKERVGPTTYRIKWTNPGDDDFGQVFIYRGETPDFSADDGKKVASVGGAPDAEMSWIDNGISADKEYYYIVRALDKAGNTSGLIGDSQVSYQQVSPTSVPGLAGTSVVQVPSGEPTGEVLKSATEEVTPAEAGPVKAAVDEAVAKIKTNRTLTTLAIAAFGLGLISYFIFRRRGY
jgi:hypothetical protein